MKNFWNRLFPGSVKGEAIETKEVKKPVKTKEAKEPIEEKEVKASEIEALLKDKELHYESSFMSKLIEGIGYGYKGPLTEESPDKRSRVILDIMYGPVKRILKKFSLGKDQYLYVLEISNENTETPLQVKAVIKWNAAE